MLVQTPVLFHSDSINTLYQNSIGFQFHIRDTIWVDININNSGIVDSAKIIKTTLQNDSLFEHKLIQYICTWNFNKITKVDLIRYPFLLNKKRIKNKSTKTVPNKAINH